MGKTMVSFQKRAENLKKDILNKYADNKVLGKQLIKSAEQVADYRLESGEPAEKWYAYLIEELEERL